MVNLTHPTVIIADLSCGILMDDPKTPESKEGCHEIFIDAFMTMEIGTTDPPNAKDFGGVTKQGRHHRVEPVIET
ncbi:hypothetical protein QJS04_geneDACA019793 [Acorus gramineus]|uniref:Uncharacterized protein n=1 Tax=Acorus gramineus TaxID=55184 RepID=A0AAV9A0U2_ACOGR|nr:hypothetical protein QJS04_geneDACA019793 [Acorus gramineus]